MMKNKEYIQLPALHRDISEEELLCIWEFAKLPDEAQEQMLDRVKEALREDVVQKDIVPDGDHVAMTDRINRYMVASRKMLKPFKFEAKTRMTNAVHGIENLKESVDTLIVIPNDKLLEIVDRRTTMPDALKKADEVLQQAVQGITDLINVPALINLDFADVQTVMKDKGLAHIGIGGATGDDKAIEAVKMAVASPLLETTINGASHVIINISGDISLMDANDAASYVQDLAGDDANIIFGAKYDESIPDAATITVIATGLENAAAPAPSILPGMKFNGGNTLNMARTAGSVKPAQTGTTPVQPQFNGIQRPQKPTPTVAPRDIKIPEFLKNTKR